MFVNPSSFSKCTEKVQMHRTKCANIIKNLLGPHFIQDLKNDVGDNKFSLLLDESTDISVQKYLGIIIYFRLKQNKIVTTFLDLAPLVGSTADDLVDSIKETLKKHNLKLKNLLQHFFY